VSDEFVIDLTNYKDRVGSRVTPGRYTVFVEDAETDTTSTGKPMINVWLVIKGGEFEGSTIIDRLLPAHEKALFRVVGFMQAIGMPTPKRQMKLNVNAFRGKTLVVDIEDGEPYNGRVKSEIRGYYKAEQTKGAPARPTSGEGDGLDEFVKPVPETSKDGDLVLDPVGDSADEVDLSKLDL
jgi:uncharacterized protein DUF669